MVKETRIVFGIEDIVAFKFKCDSCKGEIQAELERLRWLSKCPLCDAPWELNEHSTSAVKDVLDALKRLTRAPNPSRAIRFEIEGSEENG